MSSCNPKSKLEEQGEVLFVIWKASLKRGGSVVCNLESKLEEHGESCLHNPIEKQA
jgi:hypothetical protein